MGRKPSPTLVGAFVLGAIALAVVAVLVFGSGSLRDNKVLPYYYGFVSGLLLFVILFGFPLLA